MQLAGTAFLSLGTTWGSCCPILTPKEGGGVCSLKPHILSLGHKGRALDLLKLPAYPLSTLDPISQPPFKSTSGSSHQLVTHKGGGLLRFPLSPTFTLSLYHHQFLPLSKKVTLTDTCWSPPTDRTFFSWKPPFSIVLQIK